MIGNHQIPYRQRPENECLDNELCTCRDCSLAALYTELEECDDRGERIRLLERIEELERL
jgi:hypothetical protein